MEPDDLGNRTTVTEFILLGLTENVDLQSIPFVVFFFAYIVTVGGNFSTLTAILVEPKLHTSMYLFLGILSLLDFGYITVTVPPMLVCLLVHHCRVPYAACLSQLFLFPLLVGVHCHLLTTMAYDRYLGALVGICCTVSFINALTHTVAVAVLDFCGPNIVNNFYCDLPPLLQLLCSSIHLNGQLLFVGATFMGVIPMILISVSYAHVAAAVLRIWSAEGRKKAFSTCGSHLTVVCIFYVTGCFIYMYLGSVSASDKDKGIGIFNTILRPILNPVIYSLRNLDVQGTLKRVLIGKRPPS
uniref:Olfactory receptor 139-like n=1 Tax=Chinchilla lanigera TaxID=34839 RepID=A0A8C2V9G2_CHILA